MPKRTQGSSQYPTLIRGMRVPGGRQSPPRQSGPPARGGKSAKTDAMNRPLGHGTHTRPVSTQVRGQEGQARGPRITWGQPVGEGAVKRTHQTADFAGQRTFRDEVPHGRAFAGKTLPYGEKDVRFDYPRGYPVEQWVTPFSNYKGGMEFRANEVKQVASHMDILDVEPKVPPRAKNTSRGRAQ